MPKTSEISIFGVPKINNFGTGHHCTYTSVPQINYFRYWSPQYHLTWHPVAWYQVPWILPRVPKYQKPSRARPFGAVPSLQSLCPGPPKSSILRPTQRHAVMNRKHTICYTLATFCACQRHQNIDIWVSSTQHTAHSTQHSTQHTAHSTQHTARW